jgi:hypothetical protein
MEKLLPTINTFNGFSEPSAAPHVASAATADATAAASATHAGNFLNACTVVCFSTTFSSPKAPWVLYQIFRLPTTRSQDAICGRSRRSGTQRR